MAGNATGQHLPRDYHVNCPHNKTELCSWCEAAIEMHNAIVDEDCGMQEVRESARKYRGLVAKFNGIGVDELGFIVPPREGERLYPR